MIDFLLVETSGKSGRVSKTRQLMMMPSFVLLFLMMILEYFLRVEVFTIYLVWNETNERDAMTRHVSKSKKDGNFCPKKSKKFEGLSS